jgi:hypothetical protein
MSLLGFPVFRSIDVNDSAEVLRAIQLTDADLPVAGKKLIAEIEDQTLILADQASPTVVDRNLLS